MVEVRVRASTPEDRRFLVELNRAAYRELAATVFGSWDDGAQNARLEGKLASLEFRIIELEGRAVGAIATSEEVDHVRVHELMVLPAFQNRGIGSEVLRRELRSAELSRRSVRLHTALTNRAQQLYVRHGFAETGRDDKFIDFEWRGRRLTLETPRLLLRPMAVEDSDRWWEAIWSDDEVTRYLPPRKAVPVEVMPGFVRRMAEHWQNHGFGVWALLDKSTSELVGHCGLIRQEPGEVELVYAFGRSAWGRGLATEAAQCLTAFAFEQLSIAELVALVFPENAPSAHVLEKLGFVRDGETERFGASLLRYVRRVTDARIRPEEPRDRAAVRAVNEGAFETPAEANLVEAIHRDGAAVVALVAELDGRVVGHILFSPMTLGAEDRRLVGLGPMAVVPEHQRSGIGSLLVREGLARCRAAGVDAVVVLGHATFYPRFGFRPARDFGLSSEYEVPPELFMALELVPKALEGVSGVVRYHPAFAGL